MKKIKMVLWLIVFGLIALVAYQNSAYFTYQQALSVELPIIAKHYQTPSLPNIVFLLLFFGVGVLACFFLGLPGRMRTKRELRSLKMTVNSQMDIIAALKKELELVKGDKATSSSAHVVDLDRDTFDNPTQR